MCVLHVTSKTSAFSSFLKEVPLPFYQSHEKGQIKSARSEAVHEDFGFSCVVSQREWTDLPGQVEDAIRFLSGYGGELRFLLANHEIHDMRLDFPVASRLSATVLGQFDYVPPELVRLCAVYGIGIEFSHYVAGTEGNWARTAAPDDGATSPPENPRTKD